MWQCGKTRQRLSCGFAAFLLAALAGAKPAVAQEFSWALRLADHTHITFQSCQQAGSLHDVIETATSDTTIKSPGSLMYHDLVCTRGMVSELALTDWRQQVIDGQVANARTNGCLQLLDPGGLTVALWNLDNAWPAELRADLQPSVAQELLVVTHEGLQRVEGIPTVAVDDAYETAIDTQLTVAASGVLENDTSSRCGGLSASLVSVPLPSEATVSLAGDGSLTLTPAAGFTGIVSFTYEACTAIDCDQATIEVGVGVPVPVDLQSFTVASLENADDAR